MKNTLICLTLLSLFAGCRAKNETDAMRKILSYYGGRIDLSKNVNPTSGNEAKTGVYFTIKLDSTDLKKYFETAEQPASNCAYLLYQELSKREKSNDSFIRVILSEYSKTPYEFRMETLHKVEQCIPALNRTIDCFKKGQYDVLASLFNPNIPTDALSAEKFREANLPIDSTYGKISSYVLEGFVNVDVDLGGRSLKLLRLAGYTVREKQNLNFNAVFDPDEKGKMLYGFSFRR